ncbi:acetyl-CoA hydrolase/transferase family protein [Corynebacterium kroppenstedtii]|uniref:acetyl-CoA hydrolase/transferase family protein n=1 Tax=Corynebacterium sp. PCR 32 TaxID=3351342 RepID=UPI0030B30754
MSGRIANSKLRGRIMTADEAASQINPGDQLGCSGFTGAGYPKAVPEALARRIKAAHDRGDEFKVNVMTGASTAPEFDGALAEVNGINWRMPFQSDPTLRKRINAGDTYFTDLHLSDPGTLTDQGFFGPTDVAVVEAVRIREDGSIIPSSSVGCSVNYLRNAKKVIIEVNSWQDENLEGMHDIWSYGQLPNRQPIPITDPGDRIGKTYIDLDIDKVVAVVETDGPDRNSPFKPIDDDSKRIADYLLDFLDGEVKAGRLNRDLLPIQSGVGNVANAVLAGLGDGPYRQITSYTEVIQDGMVDLLDQGTMAVASATAFSLSPEYAHRVNESAADYAKKIVLRPQEITNNAEVIRRLGVIACNGMIEADIYGNVNSTHITGSTMMNGIGGSGDFARNAFVSCFVSPSRAKGGAISAIVPMVSHVDHAEHDVDVLITEQGLADLRGLAPRQRSRKIIENCAHPDYRELLLEYVERAEKVSSGLHTPHDLREALSFHTRFLETGSMMPEK